MNNREDRHRMIRHLIISHRIESQEELRERLITNGFDVTQATLSRDLKYLQVGKIAEGEDGYHYGFIESAEDYEYDLMRGWMTVAFSGLTGVVKTLPGHANSVAVALDNLEFEELLGTVAGDDTILLVLKEECTRDGFLASLYRAVPGLGEES